MFQQDLFTNSSRSYLYCFPGLLFMNFLFYYPYIANYRVVLFYDLGITGLYCAVQFIRIEDAWSSVLTIIFLGFSQLYQIIIVYSANLNERQRFVENLVRFGGETENAENATTRGQNTKIDDCIKDLKSLLPCVENKVKKTIENAICLIISLKDHKHSQACSGFIENIIKGLDEEDKIYIEET